MMSARPIVIFIPFKGQIRLLEKCLVALAQNTPSDVPVVLFDDGSTVEECAEVSLLLRDMRKIDTWHLVSSTDSCGFVKACNFMFDMEQFKECDALLLNSDTEAESGWFESMLITRYALLIGNGFYGAISPLSNNASIFTVKSRHGRPSEALEVPTCNGFCMLMSREAINAVGTFDETFLTGYGEEVDWCLRARKAGFGCYMAAGSFVRHVGSATFGKESPERAVQRARANGIIADRYPEFEGEVRRFLSSGAYWTTTLGHDLKTAFDGSSEAVVIHVIHSWDALAGVELATKALIRAMPDANHIVLYPKECQAGYEMSFEAGTVAVGISKSLVGSEWEDPTVTGGFLVGPRKESWHRGLVTALFEFIGKRRVAIHVHHVAGLGFELTNALFDAFLGASHVLDLHDYWLLCPNLFRGEAGEPCAAWEESAHNRCAACFECVFGSKADSDLERVQRAVEWHWREADKLLARPDVEFVAPSRRVVETFKNWNGSHPMTHVIVPRTSYHYPTTRPLVVVFVGNATAEKGWRVFSEAAELCADNRLSVTWVLCGQLAPGETIHKSVGIVPYHDSEFLRGHHGVTHLVPAMAGDHRETYCMVADECAATGIQILVRRGTKVVEERFPDAPRYSTPGELVSLVLGSLSSSPLTVYRELYWPHDC
jgi:GT2 family glycosyltransferase